MNTATAQLLDQIRADGYTIIEDLLSADDLNLGELDPWLQGRKHRHDLPVS